MNNSKKSGSNTVIVENKNFIPIPGEIGVCAAMLDLANNVDYVVPEQLRDEIPTMNRMGYMKLDLDEYSKEFVEFAKTSKQRTIELGCAYGAVVNKVLETGREIIASDLSDKHLSVLLKATKKEHLKNLYLYQGKFPDEINLPEESVSAVMTARMLHFLRGDEIEVGLEKINKWLVNGGKFFMNVVTPYHKSFRESFLPTYEMRVREGVEWPGEIDNHWEINPSHKDYVGQYIHLFDVPRLEKLLPKFGFRIDKIQLFDYPNDVDSAGKGHVGLVATKIN